MTREELAREELVSYLIEHGWKEEGSHGDVTVYTKESQKAAVTLMGDYMSYERTEGDDKMIAVDSPYDGLMLGNGRLYCIYGWGYVWVEL